MYHNVKHSLDEYLMDNQALWNELLISHSGPTLFILVDKITNVYKILIIITLCL
jgi:hypothetical protein